MLVHETRASVERSVRDSNRGTTVDAACQWYATLLCNPMVVDKRHLERLMVVCVWPRHRSSQVQRRRGCGFRWRRWATLHSQPTDKILRLSYCAVDRNVRCVFRAGPPLQRNADSPATLAARQYKRLRKPPGWCHSTNTIL